MDVAEACKRVHEILEGLPSLNVLSDELPRRGIYFFYEEGEVTAHTGKHRIVRVGTHGEGRSLKKRLRDHYSGNREGSVFRKYLGAALLRQEGASDSRIEEWNRRRKKSPFWHEFDEIEVRVGEILGSRFFFRVVSVDAADERRTLEEKLIATLSTCPICRPSDGWLGHFAWSQKVQESGLWNSRSVGSPAKLTESDLQRLVQLAHSSRLVQRQ